VKIALTIQNMYDTAKMFIEEFDEGQPFSVKTWTSVVNGQEVEYSGHTALAHAHGIFIVCAAVLENIKESPNE